MQDSIDSQSSKLKGHQDELVKLNDEMSDERTPSNKRYGDDSEDEDVSST
jgi:hypothetical protein